MEDPRTSAPQPLVMSSPKVAVICVNWNGWRDTLKCLESLRTSRKALWHLFVVDNASSDDSLARLSSVGDDVTVIASPINSGWSGGNNLGIRQATDAGYQLFLLLNNDATVTPDTLQSLLDYKGAQTGGAILGPLQLDGRGEEIDFLSATPDPSTGFPIWSNVYQVEIKDLPVAVDTCFIKGAAILFDLTHLAEIGYFDDQFFLNFDETDWCYRARQAGFALQIVTSSRVHHVGSSSIGGMASPLQVYFLTRNSLLFAQRHCSRRQRINYLRRLYWQARELQRGSSPNRNTWWLRFVFARDGVDAAFKRGILDYLFGRFGDCPSIIRKWSGFGRMSELSEEAIHITTKPNAILHCQDGL